MIVLSDRVTVKKGTTSVQVLREALELWKSLGYVEDKPKRVPRARKKQQEEAES